MKNFILLLFIVVISTCEAYAVLLFNKEEPVYYFVNHEEQINNIRKLLIRDKIVGITGISGIGKSEIARKYAQKYQQDYDIIAFLDASIDLIPQFVLLAKEINQKICSKTGRFISESTGSVKQNLMTYLKPQGRWLLIFDNLHINENNKIKDIIDWHHNGHIMICSQDSQYLLPRISVPYLQEKDIFMAINKLIDERSEEFKKDLACNLKGYPTNIIGHSAIFLQSNNHMTIKEYINYIRKHDNKLNAHLSIVLNEITSEAKTLLYYMALLNNQKIGNNLLEHLVDDKEKLSDLIDEIVRFGLIEQISNNRNKKVFRMHDAVKYEILNIYDLATSKKTIDKLLIKIQHLMSGEMVNQFYLIMQDNTFESNVEVLLANADKYNSNIYTSMVLHNSLLGYYLRSREPYNAKKMVSWFKEHEHKLIWQNMTELEQVAYSRYLGRIGRYEYFVVNHHSDIVMQYLVKAKNAINSLPNNEVAKSSIYYEMFQVQVFTGQIKEAEDNLHIIQSIMLNNKNFMHKASMIDYGMARILLTQGKYQQALLAIIDTISKEKAQLNKSRILAQISDVELRQENAWLAPIYTLQAEILNNMQRFEEAYAITNDVYTKIMSSDLNEIKDITSTTIAYCLTELSKSELGLKRQNDAWKHIVKAVDILIQDQDRNNRENELENSIDIFLANALVVKANILSTLGKAEEAMINYRLAKNIYWNIFNIKNIGNMDNVSYAFSQAAKTATKLTNKSDRHIQCTYFYSLLLTYFGSDHPRSKKLYGVCT